MLRLSSRKIKRKHVPDAEFTVPFSLNNCIDRLEALNGSALAFVDNLSIVIDPVDSQRWVFHAKKRTLDKMTVEITGTLLKKDEHSTLVVTRNYVDIGIVKRNNAIFIILLLIILGSLSIFVALHSILLAVLVAMIGLPPVFFGRFADLDGRRKRNEQQFQRFIRRNLE